MKIIKRFQFKFIYIFSLLFFTTFLFSVDRKPRSLRLPRPVHQVISARPSNGLSVNPQAINSATPVVKPEKPQAQKPSLPEWTMIIYVQANNNLAKYAIKNFEEMSLIGSNDKLKILVQWYDSSHKGVWRYRIDKGKMELMENRTVNIDGNKASDLVDCVKWGVKNYPAKKYFLILWNHGVGVLDPVWGRTRFSVDEKVVQGNPRIQIDGLTIKSFDFNSLLSTIEQEEHRGILFNELSRTYMTNQELSKALSEIKNNVLKRKIDILGMDACLMAMLEVGYQVKDYADYFVSSEEVELASGWPYSSILRPLAKGGFSSYDLAKNIVDTYKKLYSARISFFTQSAIDLQKIEELKYALDLVVASTKACRKQNVNLAKRIVKQARSSCLHFSTPAYIDLHSFFVELLKNVNTEFKKTKNKAMKNCLSDLKESLELAQEMMNEVVIANSVGSATSRAGGLSIYYPTGGIDNSYQRTDFAQDGLWLEFLNEFRG